MLRLLLLLLLGTVYAKKPGDCFQTEDGELVDPSIQEDDDDMPDDLEETVPTDCQLETSNNTTLEIREGLSDEATCIYRLYTSARKFTGARHVCRCHRGRLCTIHSAGVNNQLRCLAQNSKQQLVWVGVWKPYRCRGYRNIDGSRFNYSNFGCGQRKSRGRWCVALHVPSGKWISVSCNRKLSFICRQ